MCTLQQLVDSAGSQLELLHPALVAAEVEQIVDQLGQALHFLADGFQQVVLARLGRELEPLAQQAEGHVHAGHRSAQLMGSAQYEFATHAFEGSLLGYIVQHHHRAKDRPLRVADRRQAVGEQARFVIDLHVQVVRLPVEVAAAQYLA